MESFNLNNMYRLGYFSVLSDRKVKCLRVGLEVKIYDTPAGGIHASQGTWSENQKFHSNHLPEEHPGSLENNVFDLF